MIDAKDIEVQARGRWKSILVEVGVPESYLTGKHCPCLFCKGVDRWRWDNKNDNGSYICGQCGAGTSFQLIMKHLGINFQQALKRINEIINGGYTIVDAPQKPKMDEAKIKEMLNKIWNESVPLTGSCPVSKYLHARKIVLQPENTRYCPECYESDTKKSYPAMVSKIMNSAGVPVSLQRTYLSRDKPQKADIDSPRKMTPGTESLVGCAIRLFPVKTNELIVCEGIETAIACTQLFDISSWACMSNTILEGFMPPEGVRKIIICGDCDVHHVGQISAHKLAARLYKEDYIVDVRIPEILSTDWNDVLL